MLGLAMTACAPRKAENVNNGSDELAMLVGTYTDGNSKGIYTFRFNQETGVATSLSSIEVLNPSYLIPSEDGLPAEFEIQLSSGGGQFLTVYSGTVSEYGKLISYTFKGTTASDLRIVLNDDRVGVAEIVYEVR